MPFCGYCGKPVQDTARFCPYCGTPVEGEETITPPTVPGSPPSVPSPPLPTTAAHPSPLMAQGGLFDPQRTAYVIHEKTWDWGGGDILDESGQKIGRMERKIFSLRAEIKLTEMDGTLAAKIHRKIVAIRPTYEIKDAYENLIGKIEKKLLSFRPKLHVLDASGNKLLEIKGNFVGWDFIIKNMHGNQVGTVKKLDRWKDVFLGGGIFDWSDKYALRIDLPSIDRRLVVGAVIAIDNMFHDETD